MRSSVSGTWLYFKVYVGAAGMAHLEFLAAEVIPRALNICGAGRWFFLRYADEAGVHLRFRVSVPFDDGDVAARIEELLQEGARCLEAVSVSTYRPTISLPASTALDPWLGSASVPRVERAIYEPEIETFGRRGIAVAEEMFRVSSGIAIRVLQSERAGRLDRRTLIPAFMAAIPEAFCSAVRPAEFWSGYAQYWASRHERRLAGLNLSDLIAEKARWLRSRDIPLVPPDDALPGVGRALVTRWRSALRAAAVDLAACEPERSLRGLAFSFIHLMNNRLGAWFLEEVYYARLLAELQPGSTHGADARIR